jgi:hypothetical protein
VGGGLITIIATIVIVTITKEETTKIMTKNLFNYRGPASMHPLSLKSP